MNLVSSFFLFFFFAHLQEGPQNIDPIEIQLFFFWELKSNPIDEIINYFTLKIYILWVCQIIIEIISKQLVNEM